MDEMNDVKPLHAQPLSILRVAYWDKAGVCDVMTFDDTERELDPNLVTFLLLPRIRAKRVSWWFGRGGRTNRCFPLVFLDRAGSTSL